MLLLECSTSYEGRNASAVVAATPRCVNTRSPTRQGFGSTSYAETADDRKDVLAGGEQLNLALCGGVGPHHRLLLTDSSSELSRAGPAHETLRSSRRGPRPFVALFLSPPSGAATLPRRQVGGRVLARGSVTNCVREMTPESISTSDVGTPQVSDAGATSARAATSPADSSRGAPSRRVCSACGQTLWMSA